MHRVSFTFSILYSLCCALISIRLGLLDFSFVPLCLRPSVYLSLSLHVCMFLSLFLSFHLSLSLSLSFFPFLSLTLSHSVIAWSCMFTYLPLCCLHMSMRSEEHT